MPSHWVRHYKVFDLMMVENRNAALPGADRHPPSQQDLTLYIAIAAWLDGDAGV